MVRRSYLNWLYLVVGIISSTVANDPDYFKFDNSFITALFFYQYRIKWQCKKCLNLCQLNHLFLYGPNIRQQTLLSTEDAMAETET